MPRRLRPMTPIFDVRTNRGAIDVGFTPPGGCGPALFTESFDRSDGALGSNWSGDANFRVIDNQLGFDVNSTVVVSSRWVDPIGGLNQWGEIDVVTGNTGTKTLGVLLRSNSSRSNWYGGSFRESTPGWFINKAGTWVATAAAPVPTLPFRIRFEAYEDGSGNTELRLYEVVGGVPVLRVSYTDNSLPYNNPAVNTYVGITAIRSTTMRGDNWEAGIC